MSVLDGVPPIGSRVRLADPGRSKVDAYRTMRGTVAGFDSPCVLVAWDCDGPDNPSKVQPGQLASADNEEIIGYEFLLRMEDGSVLKTQLQGSGGAIGNATLHIQESAKALGISKQLLARARRELSNDGHLLACNDAAHGERFEVTEIVPAEVLNCVPMFWEKS